MPSSRGPSQPRDQTLGLLASPALAGGFFTTSATWEALYTCVDVFKTFHKGTVASWFYFLLPRLTVFSDLFTLILVGLAGSFRC